MLLAAAGWCGSCETYRAMPASDEAIAASLEPCEPAELARAAASLRHPLLAPVTIGEDGSLTPQGAAVVAVLQSPTLRAARARRGVAGAQLLQAGILPNPQLSSSIDVPIAGATDGAVNAFGLGATWDVTSLITREANRDAAARQSQAVQLDVAWQEWQVAMGAKLHATRVLWLSLLREQLQGQVGEAERVAREVERNARDGFATSIESDGAAGFLQKRRAALLAGASALVSESALLHQSMGLAQRARVRIVADGSSGDARGSDATARPTGVQLDRMILESRLDLGALRAGYESQEAKLHSAVLSQFPRVGLGITRLRDTGDVGTIGFGITLDLPIFDHAQGRIAIEKATRRQLFDELASRTFDARADAERAFAELDSVRPQIAEARRTEARLATLEAHLGAARGRGDADALQLNQVRNDLAESRLDILRFGQQEAELRIAVEVATGQLMGGIAP